MIGPGAMEGVELHHLGEMVGAGKRRVADRQRTESLGKRRLSRHVEVLVTEEDDPMGEQGLSDGGDDDVAQVFSEIEPHDLSPDPAGERLYGNGLRPRRIDQLVGPDPCRHRALLDPSP